MKRFALMGAAGYVAPKHMKAIQENGHTLVAALDPCDSVGILDAYFPEASFFIELERFDRHLEKLKRKGEAIHYISICTPNYLHDAHIRFGLRYGANVICEKPTVLNPWNMEALMEVENEWNAKVYTILQLRWHPVILALKQQVQQTDLQKQPKYKIQLTYIAPRGKWYHASWKGDDQKSGGIATNIGIHFFDMLLWIFGAVQHQQVWQRSHDRVSGRIELAHAEVDYFLSINRELLSQVPNADLSSAYRALTIDGQAMDFSHGFENLHHISYQKILSGQGFSLSDAAPSIALVHDIRNAEIIPPDNVNSPHPLSLVPQLPHPFQL